MKKHRLAVVAWAAILVLAALAADRVTCRYRLHGVSDAVQQESILYILDNQGSSYQVFAADSDGLILGRIVLPKLVGEWWYTYGSLSVDTDGQLYLYSYGKTMDSGINQSLVYRCDFEKETLIPCWELPPVKMIQTQVTAGFVLYLAPEPDGSGAFYRQDEQGMPEQMLKTEMIYSQIKAFSWEEDYGFLWTDWNGRFYRNGQEIGRGESLVRDYVNLCVEQDGIFYTDMETGFVMRMDRTGNRPNPMYPVADIEMSDSQRKHLDLLPFHYEEDGSFLTAIDMEPGSRHLAKFDSAGKQLWQLGSLEKPLLQRMIFMGKTVCAGLVVLTLVVLSARLLLAVTNGTVPILIKLLGALIPLVLIGGIVLNYEIKGTLERRILKMEYDLLHVIANQRLSRLNPDELEQINLWSVPKDPVYRKIFQETVYGKLEKTIYSPDSPVGDPVIANTYFWVFLEDRGELRNLDITDRHRYGARVVYERGHWEVEKMREAMEKQHIIKSQYNDFAGEFIVLYVPIVTTGGTSAGVMECGLNRRILTYEITKQMEQINRILTWLSGLLVTLMMLVLSIYLNPLATLKQAVDAVGDGNLGLEVAVRGLDEVAGISRAFNRMSRQLKDQITFISECSKRYAAFVPSKVFEILSRENITQVELGDQKEITAAILTLSSSQFHTMAKQMDGEALFAMVNDLLGDMIPVITAQDGVIERMVGSQVSAYYPMGSRGALLSAISICEHENRQMEMGNQRLLYRAVIHYGNIRVGIVGEQERMEAATISEIMALSSFLQKAGETYGVRILVTESAAKEIPDFFSRFHIRMIGYFHWKTSGLLEAVYDAYDGDPAWLKQIKEETDELFAQGIADYLAQRYYEARMKFARVLRVNPQDLVARTYVYRCDVCCQTGENTDAGAWLEQY